MKESSEQFKTLIFMKKRNVAGIYKFLKMGVV